MAKQHIIETAMFDIAFDNEEFAFEQQSELSSFVRKGLMTVVDELFNATSRDDSVMKIETLEIDLGAVNYSDYQDELPRRLRDKLAAILTALKVSHQQQTQQQERVRLVNSRSSEQQQIEYYLLHGYLPWYSKLSADGVNQSLIRLLNENAQWFVGFIRRSQQHDTILQRLAEQFDDEVLRLVVTQLPATATPVTASDRESVIRETIILALISGRTEKIAAVWQEILADHAILFKEQLYRLGQQAHLRKRIAFFFPDEFMREIVVLLEPVEHTFVNTVVTQGELLQQEKGAATDHAKKQLWEFSLGYLLVERGSRFNRRSYLSSLIRQMALHDNMSYQKLLEQLSINVVHMPDQTPVRKEMQKLLIELSDEMVGRSKESDHTVEPPRLGEPDSYQADENRREEELRELISQALVTGSIEDIAPYWHTLLNNYGATLKELLYHHGQQAQVRKQIAFSFPEGIIREIVALLEPVAHGFIEAVVNHSAQSDTIAKKQLWEFSLGYLLVERGSRFNKKSYISSLIRQMAAHSNMSYRKLLLEFTANVGQFNGDHSVAVEMQALLAELAHDLGDDDSSPLESASNKLINAYRHYESLQDLFGDACHQQIDEARISRALNALSHHHPWLLLKLYRQLQTQSSSGSVTWRRGLDRLSVRLLQQLTMAILGLLQADMAGRLDLKEAIHANAASANNLRHYYREILSALLTGSVIDFDAIMANGQNLIEDSLVPSRQESATHTITKQPQGGEQGDEGEATARLNDYLFGDETLSLSANAALINLFEQLTIRQPHSMERFLESIIDAPKALARLLELLPEYLLARTLLLLRMNDHARLLLCADLVTSACYGGEIVAEPNALPHLKWWFIFTYLRETGRLFNEREFVQRYIVSLMEQSREIDTQLFRARLSQQLVQNILPSTRDATARIMEAVPQVNVVKRRVEIGQESLETATDKGAEAHNEEPPLENIYITNAGIVLAAPYLPRLFQMLALTENGVFINSDAAMRAAHMVQFLVNGNSTSPEYMLVLNKLLCGIKTAQPLTREIEITAQQRGVLEGLLQGMIQNWKVLGNSSVAGLRESFLQREGRLQLRDDAWHLLVEPRSFDMLLDQIPWGYSTIKYPWMERVIYVEWR